MIDDWWLIIDDDDDDDDVDDDDDDDDYDGDGRTKQIYSDLCQWTFRARALDIK